MEPKKGRGRGRGQRNWGNNAAPAATNNLNQVNSTPRTFEAACAQIQKSLEKFDFSHDSSESDSEEDQEQEKIVQKVLQSYKSDVKDPMGYSERTQQFLIESLTSGGIVCLICIDPVKKAQAIWSCASCYGIFHLPCIQKWALDSIQIQKFELEDINQPGKDILWCCPKCRNENPVSAKPNFYECFCRKTKDPTYDPWLVPHSCGQVCGRSLKPNCGHSCLLLCHPGPCPPCAQTVRSSCYCGTQQPTIRRCSKKEWACGGVCQRILSCGQHKCDKQCHSGDCPACQKQSLQKCDCGRSESKRECAIPEWKCSNICGKALSCNHHSCQIICHSGQCGTCPELANRSCPCGKSKTDLPCTEKILACGDTCEKLLTCSFHRCAERCHFGQCGDCLQVLPKRCHCGAKEKAVPCFKDYSCDTKCKKLRNCKKHSCNRKCCRGDCPPCEQICGRTLPCKNHKCNSQCHQGPCYPCPLTVSITCNCGESKITVLCGREKVTKPPKCKQFCKKPPDCHHIKRDSHRCHFGACPFCKQICDQPLKTCEHKCPAVCHDVVLVKTESDHKRAGPWEQIPAPKIELKSFPCPPCKVPMPLTCLGKHTKHNFDCCELRPWSCGRKCGRKLACQNHSCNAECHEVKGAPNDTIFGTNCKPCEEACSLARPNECTHICLKACHPGQCQQCQQMVRRSCHCKLNTVYTVCGKWSQATPEGKDEMLCCKNQCPKEMSCGHRCAMMCHIGDCTKPELCKKRSVQRCPCKRIKQEINCNEKKALECDKVCQEAKIKESALKEVERKKEQEEVERKRQKELEEYERKFEGKKKRNRKQKQVVEDEPNFGFMMKIKLIFGSLLVVLAAIISFVLLRE